MAVEFDFPGSVRCAPAGMAVHANLAVKRLSFISRFCDEQAWARRPIDLGTNFRPALIIPQPPGYQIAGNLESA